VTNRHRPADKGKPMDSIRCKIEKVTPFNDAVYQVLLRPEISDFCIGLKR
jgi:hypothetical protein